MGSAEVAAAVGRWLRVVAPVAPPAAPDPLKAGEWETIQLALTQKASGQSVYVLLDDLAARKAASDLGLLPVGVVGVLLFARQDGLLQQVRPALDALRAGGFRLSDALYRQVLAAAEESP
ncbi:MAG: DUF3368 domain-containing protein [Armatimonadetes bacterium]|nr:DUF3368 domain-containing protein [Armatimonadota bacterium]